MLLLDMQFRPQAEIQQFLVWNGIQFVWSLFGHCLVTGCIVSFLMGK